MKSFLSGIVLGLLVLILGTFTAYHTTFSGIALTILLICLKLIPSISVQTLFINSPL